MIENIKAKAAAFYHNAVAFVKREPVVIMYAILAAVNAAAYFGFEVSPEALAAVDAVFVPFLAFITRRQVTPLANLEPMTVDKFVELYGEGDEA
jgi:uncharacterized protein involved in response to NO